MEYEKFDIIKSDSDKQLVFGWANIAIRKDGEQIVDYQGDMFDPEDLEEAAYKYVLNFRDAGEEHFAGYRKKGKLVESVVFTKEKMAAMGIPEGIVPEGWWVGFKVHDKDAWEKIKNGTYRMFSIEGAGIREEVQEEDLKKSESLSKTFAELLRKFNPYHDRLGRFATSGGAASVTIRTKDPNKQYLADMAIARMKESGGGTPEPDNSPEGRIKKAEESIRAILKEGAEVNLEGMDPDVAEETYNSIKTVLERYPEVKGAFEGFTTKEKDGDREFKDKDGTMAYFDQRDAKIYLNNKYFGNKAEFDKKYDESVRVLFHPAGTKSNSVVVHEMGHAIDYYVSFMALPYEKFTWNRERISGRFWNNDIDKARKKGDPLTGKKIRDNLSMYGSRNHLEYFAEGFAESVMSPNPRQTAKSITKRLETYIKKAEKAKKEDPTSEAAFDKYVRR